MRLAVSYNTAVHGADPDALLDLARHAERLGFEAVYLPEHLAPYPGARVGPREFPPAAPILDPLDGLAFLAAGTERILLGTGVLLLPYHHPVVLAKRLATVDVLSRGRMRLLTVGLGSLPGEARATGVDFSTRGQRADEAIDVLRLLWSGGPDGVSFAGEFFSFENLTSFPKPHRGTLPIHIGGSSRAAARRVGRRGDGWFPGGALTARERAVQLELARGTAASAGRDPAAIEYTRWAPPDLTAERAATLAARGVTRLVVSATGADASGRRAHLTALATRLGLSRDG